MAERRHFFGSVKSVFSSNKVTTSTVLRQTKQHSKTAAVKKPWTLYLKQ